MTTPDADEARKERWRLWIRARAAEHGFVFPPPGERFPGRDGTLNAFAKLVGKGSSTVTVWLNSPPNDAGCRAIARGLKIPQSVVFAAAYGTDETAEQIIPAAPSGLSEQAKVIQDLMDNPYLDDEYKVSLLQIVQGIKNMAPVGADTPPAAPKGRGRRATG